MAVDFNVVVSLSPSITRLKAFGRKILSRVSTIKTTFSRLIESELADLKCISTETFPCGYLFGGYSWFQLEMMLFSVLASLQAAVLS